MTPTDRLERAKRIVQDYKENRLFVHEIAKRHDVASGTARIYIQRDLKGLPLLGWKNMIDSDMRQSIINDYFGVGKPQMLELAAEYNVNKQQISRIIRAERERRAEAAGVIRPAVPKPAREGNHDDGLRESIPQGDAQ